MMMAEKAFPLRRRTGINDYQPLGFNQKPRRLADEFAGFYARVIVSLISNKVAVLERQCDK